MNWLEFARALIPIFKTRGLMDKAFFIISACGANGQIITDKINNFTIDLKRKLTPPTYFFVYNQSIVEWGDALLCWAILYHQLNQITDYSKEAVQSILNRIKVSDLGDIMYFRWDHSKLKYLRFKPQ